MTKAPEPLSSNRQPTIEFSANRPVAFSCQIDGGPSQPCTSPFVVPTPLGDGRHGFAVSGVDLAGREGNSGSVFFEIDATAPETSFAKRPPKILRTPRRSARGIFRFRSDKAGVAFLCQVDRGVLRDCGPKLDRRWRLGRHVVRVRARDGVGNLDPTPAVFRFRVEQVERVTKD